MPENDPFWELMFVAIRIFSGVLVFAVGIFTAVYLGLVIALKLGLLK